MVAEHPEHWNPHGGSNLVCQQPRLFEPSVVDQVTAQQQHISRGARGRQYASQRRHVRLIAVDVGDRGDANAVFSPRHTQRIGNPCALAHSA